MTSTVVAPPPSTHYSPSPESLLHRERLAKLVSPLKRVTPRVPFWYLAAHRIPTLWTLYRGLLRDAPSDIVRWRIGRLFRQYRHLTSATATKEQLVKAHRWADIFAKAKQGDARLQAILQRYSSMVAAKREKAQFAEIIRKELKWQKMLKNRPMLTGAFFRPSTFNKPLPRMKPQPIHITGMINRRREAHRHRSEKSEILSEWRSDLRTEAKYDELLAQNASKDGVKLETEYASHLSDWDSLLIEKQNALNRTLNREIERQATPFPPEMLDQIAKARQFKFRNKAREFERECRGEVLPRTIARRNKRPPAHILARMTEKQKRWDKITRNVSEVGYVAYVKQKLGFKLRNPEAWKAELGKPEDQPRLDAMEEEIRRQNIAKRVQAQRALMRGERAKRKSEGETQPKLDATA